MVYHLVPPALSYPTTHDPMRVNLQGEEREEIRGGSGRDRIEKEGEEGRGRSCKKNERERDPARA